MNRKTEINIYLTFWVIVVVALTLATVYQSTALNRDLARIPVSLKSKLPSIVLIGGIAQIFITRTVRKMKKALAGFTPGTKADRSLVLEINSRIKTLNRINLTVNSIGFFLGPTVTFIIYHFIGRGYPPWEMFFIITTHVFLGIVVYNLQNGILNMVTFDLLDSFQVHEAYPELKSISAASRRVLIVLAILSVFVFLTAGQAYGIMNAVESGNLDLTNSFSKTLIGVLVQTAIIGWLFVFVFYMRSKEEQSKLDQLQNSMQVNLDAETTENLQINIISHDDYGLLASSVNRFSSRLAELVKSITEAGQTVGKTSSELQQAVESSEQSLEVMQNINKEMSDVVNKEQIAMNAVSGAISELSESVTVVGNEVSDQAAFVEQSSAAISEMSANISSVSQLSQKALNVTSSLVEMITAGSERLSETVSSIEKLNESSEKVQSIIKVIQTISAQTNLLAMNAAIEAAHAGEAGAGFSVVANEVRNLAEQSSRSANEIRNIIVEMTSAINSGVEATDKTNEAFGQITGGVKDTSQIINTVTAAMEEQQTAADEIMTAMSSLVDVSEKLKTQADEQYKRSDSMNRTFEELTASMQELKGKSELQQEEDRKLGDIMKSLKTVSTENSAAVKSLEQAVDKN